MKITRKGFFVAGAFFLALAVVIWSQDDSSQVGQGGWIRNWYYFVPGFASFCLGGWSINRTFSMKAEDD